MSKNRLPEIKDPLKEIANLAINPAIKETPNISMEVKNIVEKVPEIAVTGDMVFGKRENPHANVPSNRRLVCRGGVRRFANRGGRAGESR